MNVLNVVKNIQHIINMKFKKRSEYISPLISLQIFLLPLLTYLIGKLNGLNYDKEYIWWIIIPLLFLIWFFINYKIIKNEK